MLSLVTPPIEYPVTLNEIKDHLNVYGVEDDDHLNALLAAATDYVERELNRSLLATVWDDVRCEFPTASDGTDYPWVFQRSPLSSITSITYYNSTGGSTTWSSTNYYSVTPYAQQGWIEPKSSWPATYVRPDAVTIRYTAGYADRDNVPAAIKHAIKLLAGHWFENREEEMPMVTNRLKLGVDALLATYKTGSYF